MESKNDNCPVCLCVLIEPVTLPCAHELCMPCYEQYVAETSLYCPLCRTRLSVWARHAVKKQGLVNQARWREIQDKYPDRVKHRLQGEDDQDEYFESCGIYQSIAEPGLVRQEYEQQREKIVEKERQEEEASMQLITQLQEDEDRNRQQEIEDAKLAFSLSKELNGVSPVMPVVPETTRASSPPNLRHQTKKPLQKSVDHQQGRIKMWFTTSPRNTSSVTSSRDNSSVTSPQNSLSATRSRNCSSTPQPGPSCSSQPVVMTTLLTPDSLYQRQEAVRHGENPESVVAKLPQRQEAVLNKRRWLSESSPSTDRHSTKDSGRKRLCLEDLGNHV